MQKNLFDVLVNSSEINSLNIAFKQVLDGHLNTTNYAELMQKIMEYRIFLEAYALMPGARVAIFAPTSPAWIISYFACLSLRLTVVCVDPGVNAEQLHDLIQETKINLLITDDNLFSKLALPIYSSLMVLDIKSKLSNLYAPTQWQCQIDTDSDPDIASILFTSGTTGGIKGVLLEHEALLNAVQLCIEAMQVTEQDNALCLLPAHHVYTLVCVILSALCAGSTITFVEKLEGAYILQAMQLGKPTMLVGVPRIYELLSSKILGEINKKNQISAFLIKKLISCCAAIRKITNINLGHILFAPVNAAFGGKMHFLISGAAPLPDEIFNLLYGVGFVVLEGYGLTETCGSIIVNPLAQQKVGSVGKAMRNVEINIHAPNETGVGEIWVRSPTLMRGYLHDKKSTDEALTNGWYHTGDLGTLDKQGFLYITGRIKELIVLSNGKKISPAFVESFLVGLPYVEGFAVVGIPDRKTHGENIHISVVIDKAKINSLGKQDCITAIKNEIDKRAIKMPKWCQFSHIHFIDAIPKTSSLKVKRNELAKILQNTLVQHTEEDPLPAKNAKINDGVENEIIKLILQMVPDINPKELTGESSLQFDTNLDSLYMQELVSRIEKKYDVNIDAEQLSKAFRIRDLAKLVYSARPKQYDESIFLEGNDFITIQNNFTHLSEYTGFKKYFSAFCSHVIKKIFFFYFHYNAVGLENIDPQLTYIVSANHTSHLDNFSLSLALNQAGKSCVAAAAKDYFFDNKGMAYFSQILLKVIPFDRSGHYLGLKKNVTYIKLCKEHALSVLIFPEGTRSTTGEIHSFKNGIGLLSDLLDMPILPAYIQGAYQSFPKGKKFPSPGKIQVRIGKAISIREYFAKMHQEENKTEFSLTDYQLFVAFIKDKIIELKENHDR